MTWSAEPYGPPEPPRRTMRPENKFLLFTLPPVAVFGLVLLSIASGGSNDDDNASAYPAGKSTVVPPQPSRYSDQSKQQAFEQCLAGMNSVSARGKDGTTDAEMDRLMAPCSSEAFGEQLREDIDTINAGHAAFAKRVREDIGDIDLTDSDLAAGGNETCKLFTDAGGRYDDVLHAISVKIGPDRAKKWVRISVETLCPSQKWQLP